MGRKLPKILITAGPTREYLDPTRFMSNPSSGKMGLYLAEEAKRRGCDSLLILGPSQLTTEGIKTIRIVSARDLFENVKKYFKQYDVLIMAAAVSDYRPIKYLKTKMKKEKKSKWIKLVLNPDILSWAGRNKKGHLLVGFAAETNDVIRNAQKKLKKKNLDMIVANQVGMDHVGFNATDIQYSIIETEGEALPMSQTSKRGLSKIIIEKVIKKYQLWK